MTNEQMIAISVKEGFADAAVVNTADIVFDAAFRPYCEENLCGQYGVNYSCPPECGTAEEMEQKILKHRKALVFRTVWSVADIRDSIAIKFAKQKHNVYTFNVIEQLKKQGHEGFMIGASCCSLCNPCELVRGNPCMFPQKKYSCMSAYCIYVKDLADKCGMVYDYKDNLLPLFSMYVFD